MNWFFATNKGGRDSGFNDSGIETFKGNFFRYLARELIQNSLDARNDKNKPVVVRFEPESLSVSDFPDAPAFLGVVERCQEYWTHDKKATKFFVAAKQQLSERKIPCLKIGDYNTRGVRGSDSARDKDWYNLIRCSGSSSKGGGEGGSFGIGKNAPFAASDLRTVLYSTNNIDGEVAFQGVANLVTHHHASGELAQPVGYLGGDAGASIRTPSQIPSRFKREKLGTDIWVVGFHQVADWQSELIFSILDNFWPAIHFRDLEVYVGGQKIASSNLEEMLAAHSQKDGFTAHHYFKAFTAPTQHIDRKLPTLGPVDLYLLLGDLELPKRIAMVRSSGMVIEARLVRSPLPFCGVFLCRNEVGNKKLREMEPPRHDVWDPDHPEKGANKKTELEFVAFLRECVRGLSPADDSKSIAIPGLSKFLPDDEDSVEETFGGSGSDVSGEGADRHAKPQKLDGKKIDPKRRQLQPDSTKLAQGADETSSEAGGDGAMPPDGDSNGNEGSGVNPNDADGQGTTGGDSGAPGGGLPKQPIPIAYRTFAVNSAAGVYAVVITPRGKKSDQAIVRIHEIGDDGSKIPAAIKLARSGDGAQIAAARNVIGPLELVAGKATRIEVVLESPARVAMGVEAHEA